MGKLFIQTLPTQDQIQESIDRLQPGIDAAPFYLNMLFMKVATDIDNYTDQVLAPYNLSNGRFLLLFVLRDLPQGLMPSEMSQQLGVTQATISGLINGLEKQELVRRESHEKDGRSFVIKITEKGDTLIREIFPKWAPKMTSFWGQFPPEERETLKKILEKMSQTSVLFTLPK